MGTDIVHESWQLAGELIANSLKMSKNNLFGLGEIEEEYLKRKEYLIPYFDEDLRLRINIEEDKEPFYESDILSVIHEWKEEKVYNLYERKRKYYKLGNCETAMNFIASVFKKELETQEIVSGKLNSQININGKTLDAGTKISKYLKCLAENENEERLYFKRLSFENNNYSGQSGYYYEDKDLLIEYILDLYSQIFSSIKDPKGIVVLSINPVDFMLASAHTDGDWTSCHNFQDGCYKTGVLSYALDEVSMIAYAYNKTSLANYHPFKKEMPLKLWRQMVYLDERTRSIYFSKNYPGVMPIFSKYARKLAGKMASKLFNVEPVWKVSGDYVSLLEGEKKVPKCNTENQGESHFNYADGIYSSIAMMEGGKFVDTIFTGVGALICPICGDIKDIDDDDGGESFACYDCRNGNRCFSCGRAIGDYDGVVTQTGEHYCLSCAEEHVSECSICENIYSNEDMEEIEYIDEDGDMIIETVCEDCFHTYFSRCTECNELYKTFDANNVLGLCPRCYEKMLEKEDKEIEVV